MNLAHSSASACISWYELYTPLYLILQEFSVNSEHIWLDTNASGDFCYAMEQDCIVRIHM